MSQQESALPAEELAAASRSRALPGQLVAVLNNPKQKAIGDVSSFCRFAEAGPPPLHSQEGARERENSKNMAQLLPAETERTIQV